MAEFNLTAPAFLLEYRSVTLYQEWLNLGNEGTMADFIAWLRTPATEAAAQALQAAAEALAAAQTLGQGIAAAEAAATLANTKAGLANDAAILANEKAALVDSAATLANTKAGLANDAAILATDKAALADSKATLANDKAILAQSAADNANAKAAEVTAAVLSAGYLGTIKPTDAAPTPARNGNYTFSIGGNKPAWLTAEAGVTTVKAGDGVAVVYTAPSTYTYTHVNMASGSITTKELKNWFINESYEITGTITYDSKGNINTPVSILWVSGATGVLNVTRDSNGNATTWNATHILESITKTITQPTVTRDSLGNITNKPAITIA